MTTERRTSTLAGDLEQTGRAQWRRLEAVLRGFFRARVDDPELRADLVQDVLLRMHERREQLREDDRLDAWAFRIARNALADHYRSRRVSEPLPELSEPAPEPGAGERDAAPHILGAWLRVQIAELPPRDREVLELIELRGLSQREAAEQLGLPYSTLKSRVQRGRERLHAALLGCCAVELDARGRVTDFTPRGGCGGCDCAG